MFWWFRFHKQISVVKENHAHQRPLEISSVLQPPPPEKPLHPHTLVCWRDQKHTQMKSEVNYEHTLEQKCMIHSQMTWIWCIYDEVSLFLHPGHCSLLLLSTWWWWWWRFLSFNTLWWGSFQKRLHISSCKQQKRENYHLDFFIIRFHHLSPFTEVIDALT